jgi:site-specific DNA-methyltransferase (adenine-specific)
MKEDKTRSFNLDCLEFMQSVPDKFYDLAIVDPPYGIGEDGGNKNRKRKKDNHKQIVKHEKKDWDNIKPNQTYFKELFRVSKNQIIWGGNYFSENLESKMGWVFWNKLIGGDFSDGELAWTSWNRALRMFTFSYHGDTKGGHTRIHPTQKPIKLYEWILINYAKEGDKILDTHGGSQSSRIACFNLGFELDIVELDKDYFDQGNKRFEQHKKQLTLF